MGLKYEGLKVNNKDGVFNNDVRCLVSEDFCKTYIDRILAVQVMKAGKPVCVPGEVRGWSAGNYLLVEIPDDWRQKYNISAFESQTWTSGGAKIESMALHLNQQTMLYAVDQTRVLGYMAAPPIEEQSYKYTIKFDVKKAKREIAPFPHTCKRCGGPCLELARTIDCPKGCWA